MAKVQESEWPAHGDCCSVAMASAAHAHQMHVQPVPALDVCDDASWAFIVGAPRCGTTSLSRYLYHHPDVCFSHVKEPHFFAATDYRSLSDPELRFEIRNEYLDRFFAKRKPGQALAEGSVTYLYVPEQMEPILRLWPQAKFVIGVRNPLTMLPSLHQRLRYNGDETVRDFARAWALVPERRQGRSVPRSCAHARWLDYWEAGRLGKYVEAFFEQVGRERCFVYDFDDFLADPSRVYREMLAFLGIRDDGREIYLNHRATKDYKIGWLQRALRRPPRSLAALGGDRYRRLFIAGPEEESGRVIMALWRARDRILNWNKTAAVPTVLDPALRSKMIAMYRDDVAHLGKLLGRDLSHWLDED